MVGCVLFVVARIAPLLFLRATGNRLPTGAAGLGVLATTRRDASPFALVLGYLVAENLLRGRPSVPPADAAQTLYFALLVLGLLSAAYECRGGAAWRFYLPISLALVLLPTVWLLVRPLAEHAWNRTEAAAWIGGLCLAAIAMTVALDRLFAGRPGVGASAGLVLVLSLAAPVLAMSGTKTYGQLAASGAAALFPGVAAAAAGWTGGFSRRMAPAFVLLLGGMLLTGHLLANLTVTNAVLLLLAPLAMWIDRLSIVGHWAAWQRGALALVAAALPAGAAVALAAQKFLEDMASGY